MSKSLGDIRNLLILSQIIITLLIPSVMTNNIGVANIQQQNSNYKTAQNIVIAFVAMTVILLVIQLIIIFVGVNQTNLKHIAYQIIFHFVGALLFGYYIISPLHYSTIWYIWAVFVFLPFIWDIIVTGVKGTNMNKYVKVLQNQRIDN